MELFLLLVCFLFSILSSGIETAVTTLHPLNIVRGRKKRLLYLYSLKKRIVTTMLLTNNLALVGATLAVEIFLQNFVGSIYIRAIILGVHILMFFFFAEVLPKTIFERYASKILSKLYLFIFFIHYLFLPLSTIFIWISKVVEYTFPTRFEEVDKEDIFYFIRSHFGEKKAIFNTLLSLEKIRITKVMKPVLDLYSVSYQNSMSDVAKLVGNTAYTRYPVYQERADNIIGYISIEDILRSNKKINVVSSVMHEAIYVFALDTTQKVFFQMKKEEVPIVFIVNEYGNVIGAVTMEDILEEIVGEIFYKEQKEEKQEILSISENEYLIDASLHLDNFNEFFTCNIKYLNYSTLNAYLILGLQRFPQKGDVYYIKEGKFIIEKADEKKIHLIRFFLYKQRS